MIKRLLCIMVMFFLVGGVQCKADAFRVGTDTDVDTEASVSLSERYERLEDTLNDIEIVNEGYGRLCAVLLVVSLVGCIEVSVILMNNDEVIED